MKPKRALVISGGGSKGAFAGGFAEYLIRDLKREYDIYIGTSTGSLLVPFLAIDAIEKVKEVYTNVGQKDIYNISPFRVKRNKDGTLNTRMNHFNILKMFLKGKKTFGEHKNLRKLISKSFTEEHFNAVKASRKKVIATVSNLSRNFIEYKYAADHSYEDFCDWMWISSSFVPFMSLVEKNGYEYADGGFGNVIPIEEAINIGATEIDVIILNPRTRIHNKKRTKNAFDVLMRSMQFMLRQIAKDDIYIGQLENVYNHDIQLHLHYTPRLLTEYSFYFNPKEMSQWWDEGYACAKEKFGG
jgi:predicted patatin/cPLA2 family phospholipase